MPRIIIDGESYEVAEGRNLLEVCLELGIDLPYFCWHPALGSIGACRQCAVLQLRDADDTHGRIVMGCMTPVSDGTHYSVAGERAKRFRSGVIESMMTNHPHDCPVCAEGGECHLQDMTVMTGHRDRRFRGRKRTFRNQYLGPLIHHEMNRCITCYRCTRYYGDYAGGTDLAALASRNRVYFGRHDDGVLESEFAGNLVEVCPTGVFTDRPLVHDYTRKWDLQSAPSICQGCAVGCNTSPGERHGRLKRVHNRYNAAVNGYFLCDRGRYGHSWVNDPRRLDYSARRGSDDRFAAIHGAYALQHAEELLAAGPVAGIGSPRASIEANFLLRELVGRDNWNPGFDTRGGTPLERRALTLLRRSRATIPDLPAVESADAVLIVGEDVTASAARLALALRQSVRNAALDGAAAAGLAPWQDAAVRNLAQEQRNPLFIAAPGSTRLDDIAAGRLSGGPADISAFADSVLALLRGEDAADALPLAREAADALRSAQRPLIIGGSSCADAALLDAASLIADALVADDREAMLTLIVPEVNSLGAALLADDDTPDLAVLTQRAAAGDLQTLLVLENDLYERAAGDQIDALLGAFPQVIVLDALETDTAAQAQLVLASASPLESEGSVVNLEGRAQRYYPVFEPRGESRPSWQWLLTLLQAAQPDWADIQHFDAVVQRCAKTAPLLAALAQAGPGHDDRLRVPRQPERYSGRTAISADISVHEPQRPADEESPLSFSMEGYSPGNTVAAQPFVWSPGWNSNHALHKFQAEIGGALRQGNGGVRLLDDHAAPAPDAPASTGSATSPAHDDAGWVLVPRPVLFGSETRSALSAGIEELVPQPFVALNARAAEALGVTDGDGVRIDGGDSSLEVRIDEKLADGYVAYAYNFSGCRDLRPGTRVALARDESWRRADADLIARSGESTHA